jgi:AraC-like DNA-binding protein
MTLLETGLRGAAIALLLLLAIAGWRDARRLAAARQSVLFDLCAIAYLIESAPPLATLSAAWMVPIRLISTATPAVFQHWVAANFDDFFVPTWWRWLPFGGMIGLASWATVSDWSPAWRVTQVAALLLVVTGIFQALAGRKADLIEGRRRLRLLLALGAGLWVAALTAFGAIASRDTRVAAGAVTTSGIVALALAAALMRLRVEPAGISVAPPALFAGGRPPGAPAVAVEAEERALLDRLLVLMERDHVYREHDFGLSMLASRLTIPEYRLRRLVNQHLGHRNFTSFVNGYRLADAMRALADPAQKQVPILTIALDAGFQSIGPFNRAFKAHTGLTPSAFRRSRIEQARAQRT